MLCLEEGGGGGGGYAYDVNDHNNHNNRNNHSYHTGDASGGHDGSDHCYAALSNGAGLFAWAGLLVVALLTGHFASSMVSQEPSGSSTYNANVDKSAVLWHWAAGLQGVAIVLLFVCFCFQRAKGSKIITQAIGFIVATHPISSDSTRLSGMENLTVADSGAENTISSTAQSDVTDPLAADLSIAEVLLFLAAPLEGLQQSILVLFFFVAQKTNFDSVISENSSSSSSSSSSCTSLHNGPSSLPYLLFGWSASPTTGHSFSLSLSLTHTYTLSIAILLLTVQPLFFSNTTITMMVFVSQMLLLVFPLACLWLPV